MNKASGKLVAGVRKVKTQQKAPAAVERAPAAPAAADRAAPAAPKRAAAAPRAAAAALYPDRIWPD